MTLYEPDDPRFKALGRELKIHWHHARSLMVSVFGHMTDQQVDGFRPKILDAVGEMDGFANAILEVGFGHSADDGTIIIHGHEKTKWLGKLQVDRQLARQAGGFQRVAGAKRDGTGKFLPKEPQLPSSQPAGDQLPTSSPPGEIQVNPGTSTTPPRPPARARARELQDLDVGDFLDEFSSEAQASWIEKWGLDNVRHDIVECRSKWETDNERNREAGKGRYLWNFLRNAKKDRDNPRPEPPVMSRAASDPRRSSASASDDCVPDGADAKGAPTCRTHGRGNARDCALRKVWDERALKASAKTVDAAPPDDPDAARKLAALCPKSKYARVPRGADP